MMAERLVMRSDSEGEGEDTPHTCLHPYSGTDSRESEAAVEGRKSVDSDRETQTTTLSLSKT